MGSGGVSKCKLMAQVKILIEGYTSADKPGKKERTCPTITLVRDGKKIIVVDPGTLANQGTLVGALKKEGLTPDQVNTVFLTHSHIDHFVNIGMFPKAAVVEYYGVWRNNVVEDRPTNLTKDIKILETPGHSFSGLTLLVKTPIGKIAVCGDVFWKEDYPKKDPYADNPKTLREMRKKLLKIADYIIPGHAGMFQANLATQCGSTSTFKSK